jgi:hypothetical protein
VMWGLFGGAGSRLVGETASLPPNWANFLGGRLPPNAGELPVPLQGPLPPDRNLRAAIAEPKREHLRKTLGDRVDQISDAELLDSIYYTVFPNFHPWGSFNPVVYRFRPNGSNPDECIHECMYFEPVAQGAKRPPAAPIHWLGPDDDWVDAPELGMLAKVFNQDVANLPHVQKGLKTTREKTVVFGEYGESKIRHFHQLLDEWIEKR